MRRELNASSGPQRCWAITMPMACSITERDDSAIAGEPVRWSVQQQLRAGRAPDVERSVSLGPSRVRRS